ncbi:MULTISPECIES: beta-propeller fold lactonase family protein [Arthrobacter]|uniref:Beta-propeller fold lactonase family protein n=2 Tax=Arthrobacter TaxID=1663 RepID=A0ABU9KS66_9MICC|nr:beta-propeller fold lactonase family protein [Arthrobacter sp. YJM1]MDP5228275.1 beta-propeller fold lactonase family protein [Arthrobacter sp. YJM1]
MTIQLWLGSYTEDGAGRGRGVQRVSVDPTGDSLRVEAVSRGVRNPSFLHRTADGRLFAVEELDAGQVVELDPETLAVLARASSGGAHPCHISSLDDGDGGRLLLVSNYSSGTVSALPLDREWGPGSERPVPLWTVGQPGSGPVADRQDGPHAHSTLPLGSGRFLLADLGRDRVDEYALTPDGPALVGGLDLPPGTGPRHLLLDGDSLWIVGELDAALHRATRRGEAWALKGPAVSLAPGAEVAYPSELAATCAGDAIVVAVRGADALAVVGVDGELRGSVPCGEWPRHLAWVSDDAGERYLCVAAERGHRLDVYGPGTDGVPVAQASLETLSPTFVLPVG